MYSVHSCTLWAAVRAGIVTFRVQVSAPGAGFMTGGPGGEGGALDPDVVAEMLQGAKEQVMQ